MKIVVGTASIGLLLVLAFAGCTRVVYRDQLVEPDPPPPPPAPAAQLLGTWRTTGGGYWVEDQLVGHEREILTFTEERWIRYTEQVRFDGTVDNSGAESGGWSASDTAITKKWIDTDTEPPVEAMHDHDYYLVDGDLLILRQWSYPGPARADWQPDLFRYERLKNALPDLVGTWKRPLPEDPDDAQLTIILREDGTFRYHSLNPGDWDFVMEGNWRHDAENLYIPLTEISASNYGEPWPDYWTVELNARFAYAPVGDADTILVSGWWNEPPNPNLELPQTYGSYSGGASSLFYRQEDQE